MPFLFPIIGLALAGWGVAAGALGTSKLEHPSALPNGNTPQLDLTRLGIYAIGGGLVYYFGKKLLKG